MKFLGLHWIDVLILLTYIVAVLVIGKIFSHGVKGEKDFFLGGRSLGLSAAPVGGLIESYRAGQAGDGAQVVRVLHAVEHEAEPARGLAAPAAVQALEIRGPQVPAVVAHSRWPTLRSR